MKDDRKLLVLVEHLKNYACLVFLATYSAHLRFINGEEKKFPLTLELWFFSVLFLHKRQLHVGNRVRKQFSCHLQ